MRMRGSQDNRLHIDGTVFLRDGIADCLTEDFRYLQKVERNEGGPSVAGFERDDVGRQRGIGPGRQPQAELPPQGHGLVWCDIDRGGSDLQLGTVQQGWE